MPQKSGGQCRLLFKNIMKHPEHPRNDEIDCAFRLGEDSYFTGEDNPYNECDSPELYSAWERGYTESEADNDSDE